MHGVEALVKSLKPIEPSDLTNRVQTGTGSSLASLIRSNKSNQNQNSVKFKDENSVFSSSISQINNETLQNANNMMKLG